MVSNIFFWTFSTLYLIFLVIFGISLLFAVFTQIPYVPSRKHVIKEIIRLAKIKNGQTVLDLGCGDLRLLIRASKNKNITAIGYELSPMPYILGRINKFITRSKAQIKFKNFFKENWNQADIIFVYLIPDILEKIGDKIKVECKPGTTIISHTFKIPNLPITKEYNKNPKLKLPRIYIYQI